MRQWSSIGTDSSATGESLLQPRTPIRSKSWASAPSKLIANAGDCATNECGSNSLSRAFHTSGRAWKEGNLRRRATPVSLRFAGAHALCLPKKVELTAAWSFGEEQFLATGAGTQVSRNLQGSAQLIVLVESEFDIACWVCLEEGWPEGAELPLIVPAGQPCSANFGGGPGGIQGTLVVEGFEHKLPFRVRARASSGSPGPGPTNFVGRVGQLRSTEVASARKRPDDLAHERQDAGGGGIAAEFDMSRDTPSQLFVRIRTATAWELAEESQTRRQKEQEEKHLEQLHETQLQHMLTTSCGHWPISP